MITAYTRPFRNRVDAFGIAGGYAENDDGDARRYSRVWKQIEVAGEGSDRFLDMLARCSKTRRSALPWMPRPLWTRCGFHRKAARCAFTFLRPETRI